MNNLYQHLKKRVVSYAVVAIIACLVGGCGDTASEAPPQPMSRMDLPEYREKLNEQREVQNQLMREMAQAYRELKAAEATDPSGTSEAVKQAQATVAAAEKKLEEARQEAQALVREYIWKELNANEAQQKKGN